MDVEQTEPEEAGTENPDFTPVNTVLVLVNVVVFLLMTATGAVGDNTQMIQWGAMYTPLMKEPGEMYRIVTSMFLHFDISHITGNMIILLALGVNLERAFGKWKYLLLYVLSGAGAGLVSFVYNDMAGNVVVAAGASGAIFGVIGALFVTALVNRGRPGNITAPKLGAVIVYILYTGFQSPGTDNAAHIGGLLTGLLLAGLLRVIGNKK